MTLAALERTLRFMERIAPLVDTFSTLGVLVPFPGTPLYEDFHADYKLLDDSGRGVLRLYLKYHNEQSVIRELRRVSSPGLRRYVKCRELPRVKNGLGMAIVSTPKGLMTDREARSANLGGELLAVVW